MNKSTQGTLAIALLVISVSTLIFVQQPIATDLQDAEREHSTIQSSITQIATDLSTAESHVAEMEEMSASQKRDVAEAISETYQQDDLIEDLVALAGKNYVEVSSMSFTKDGEADVADLALDTITIGLFSPNQRQFIRFLEALEDDARIYRIKKISADYESTTVETSLLLETYHF